MRWTPETATCAECGFDWTMSTAGAVGVVEGAADRLVAAFGRIGDPFERSDVRWSPSMYLWHLVDVLRIGRERLLTLSLDPDGGIPCWDENALADVRKYEQLSPVVGLVVARGAARDWCDTAWSTPEQAEVIHAQLGALGALEVIRRNAHEIHHHIEDLAGGLQTTTGS